LLSEQRTFHKVPLLRSDFITLRLSHGNPIGAPKFNDGPCACCALTHTRAFH
jgi:hypothetical protein